MNDDKTKELIEKYIKDTECCIEEGKKIFKYNPVRFIQLRNEHGNYFNAAKYLLLKEKYNDSGNNEIYYSRGFTDMIAGKRYDLTTEYRALFKFPELFTNEELEICKQRLKKWGCNTDNINSKE